jgi:Bacterial toxin 33
VENGRNWQQDKLLSSGEIAKLKQSGIDIHDLKGGRSASRFDLYKDEAGDIYIK